MVVVAELDARFFTDGASLVQVCGNFFIVSNGSSFFWHQEGNRHIGLTNGFGIGHCFVPSKQNCSRVLLVAEIAIEVVSRWRNEATLIQYLFVFGCFHPEELAVVSEVLYFTKSHGCNFLERSLWVFGHVIPNRIELNTNFFIFYTSDCQRVIDKKRTCGNPCHLLNETPS